LVSALVTWNYLLLARQGQYRRSGEEPLVCHSQLHRWHATNASATGNHPTATGTSNQRTAGTCDYPCAASDSAANASACTNYHHPTGTGATSTYHSGLHLGNHPHRCHTGDCGHRPDS